MIGERLVETFNTHRMPEWVILAVATSRERELREIMKAVRGAVEQVQSTPQHLIVYGERGAGKSFLMRMVEIEIGRLARDEGCAVVAALLPEEVYNIRSVVQLLAAVVASVESANWSQTAFTFDARSQTQAWAETEDALWRALDSRFGAGRGVVVAMVENFDTLAKDLFGSEPLADSRSATPRAIERNAAEQLLRRLLSTPGGRFMLVAAATGTVDQDYERPLFQMFKEVDLEAWTSEDCIAYFNRRRAMSRQPELTPREQARVRAITRFIGGNPRLAQLLSDVIDTSDPKSIASILDALSDHLADYYRRRLDDLSPQSAALLDALIRGGEPATQETLSARVRADDRAQMADAFNRLIHARLLAAEVEAGGNGTLYRVRDRLFVHFYRRRYGGTSQSQGLAPVAELLERFFTKAEREALARRRLEAGEWVDAEALAPEVPTKERHYCGFRDRYTSGLGLELLFAALALNQEEASEVSEELRQRPARAVKRWRDKSQKLDSPLQRAAALALEATALTRRGLDEEALTVLQEAKESAGVDADAQILLLYEVGLFFYYRRNVLGKRQFLVEIGTLIDRSVSPVARFMAEYSAGVTAHEAGHAEESLEALGRAAVIAQEQNWRRSFGRAQVWRAFALASTGKFHEALPLVQDAVDCATQVQNQDDLLEAETIRGWVLGNLKNYEQALASAERAISLAQTLDASSRQADALQMKSNWEVETARYDAALATARQALDLSVRTDDLERRRRARAALFNAATEVAIPDASAQLKQVLASFKDADAEAASIGPFLNTIVTMTARSSAWRDLAEGLTEFPEVLSQKRFRVFGGVGKVWADIVRAGGSEALTEDLTRNRDYIFALVERVPLPSPSSDTEDQQAHIRRRHINDMLTGFVRYCEDPSALTEMADLVKVLFKEDSEEWPDLLRAFALVREASDKTQALQQLDPDLATTIRTLLSLPDPSDMLARRGRMRGR